MLIKELLTMKLFSFLSSPSTQEPTEEKMQAAYETFTEQIRSNCNSEDKDSAYRTLKDSCIELEALNTLYRYKEEEKDILKNIFLQKALSFVKHELDLLLLKIQYPDQFSQPLATHKSDLYIIPKSSNLGIIGLAEIVVGLHLSENILGADGKPAPLIRIARVFEQSFNVSFGDIYDKQEALFNRKPNNRTKALNLLRDCIKEKDSKR